MIKSILYQSHGSNWRVRKRLVDRNKHMAVADVTEQTVLEVLSGKCCRGWGYDYIYASSKTFHSSFHYNSGLPINDQGNADS